MIKGIIFDLDGVLIHTDELHYRAWKELADYLGIYFDREINEQLRGVSRMASLEIILGENHFSDTEKEMLAAEKNEKYRTLLATLKPSDVSDEVRKTLEALKEKGMKLAKALEKQLGQSKGKLEKLMSDGSRQEMEDEDAQL